MAINNPLDYAELERWCTAKSITLSGDIATSINDLSGNDRHLNVRIGTPTYGGSDLNNNKGVIFTSSDSLNNSEISSELLQPFTELVLFSVPGYVGDNPILGHGWSGGGGGYGQIGVAYDGAAQMGLVSIFRGGDAGAIVPNQVHVLSCIFNGSDSKIYIDNVLVVEGTCDETRYISKDILNGYHTGPTGSMTFGEFFRVGRVLTEAELTDSYDYLQEEWKDNSIKGTMGEPTGYDSIKMATTTVPADSIVFGDTFFVGDQVAVELEATHTNGSKGSVSVDQFTVPTITGTDAPGDWTFHYWIKDANGDNSATYLVTITVNFELSEALELFNTMELSQ